jgi:hypothetical protein
MIHGWSVVNPAVHSGGLQSSLSATARHRAGRPRIDIRRELPSIAACYRGIASRQREGERAAVGRWRFECDRDPGDQETRTRTFRGL